MIITTAIMIIRSVLVSFWASDMLEGLLQINIILRCETVTQGITASVSDHGSF